MKFKKETLKFKLWTYLIVFSILIIGFLWVFQVLFLNTFYEYSKTNEMNIITRKIIYNYKHNNNITSFVNTLDNISYEQGVCIELVTDDVQIQSYNRPERGCSTEVNKTPSVQILKSKFINDNKTKESYKIENDIYDNKILLSGIKLDTNYYAFVSISLKPLDSTIGVLKNQLIIVTITVLILSSIIALFISKELSNPIIKVSKSAKKLAKKDFDVVFDSGSNIEELNELTDSLNYARDELSKTEELRRELMANVSHDLKTPLTMIRAYAEMVKDISYKDKIKREENLNIIIEETDRLNLLVNDILDLSSIESGTAKLNKEEFDLNLLIIDILRRYRYLEETENYIFVYNQISNINIFADKKRIEQVIYNLINNAINYTGDNKKVEIKIINNKKNYRIEIIDTGKGIDSKDLNLIWDKYYKTDKNHTRNTHGTGVGLSIVKNILINHNYNYGVISKKNKGTTFYFEIPKYR